MLMLGNAINAEIKNSKFINTTKEHGGYGIKTWNFQWVTHRPTDVDNSKVELKNVNIHHNEFNLYPRGGWNNGASVNICVELYNSRLNGCLIENNTFVGNLSMVGDNAPKAEFAMKVRNNQFLLSTIDEGYQYAIENDFSKVEIAYNYIQNGRYPVASWHAGVVTDLNVHNNVFDRIMQPDGILLFSGAPRNLTFENNTVLYDEKAFNFNGPKEGNCVLSIKVPVNIDKISVRNNIFYCYDGDKKNNVLLIQIPVGTSIIATNVVIDNNAFYNWIPDGTSIIEVPAGGPMFKLSGKTYADKYGLQQESVCYGKNLGAIN
jgi:hypothetical protein